MATTRYTHRAGDDLAPYCQRSTPLLPPVEAAQRYHTLVARWSSVDFDRPVPLVDRRDLEEGDVVFSSFGRSGRIVRLHKSDHPVSQDLYGKPHLNKTVQIWFEDGQTERSEGSMPLLADADGTVYGETAWAARRREATAAKP